MRQTANLNSSHAPFTPDPATQRNATLANAYIKTNIHCVSKKQYTRLLITTLANVDRFSNFFTDGFPKKLSM